MKPLYLALWMVAGILQTGHAQINESSLPTNPLPTGYYVVVAAYRSGQQDFAERFKTEINQKGLHSEIGFDTKRKLFYVFVERSVEFKESIQQMLNARNQNGFDRAWVRIINDEQVIAETQSIANAVKQQLAEKKETKEAPLVISKIETKQEVKQVVEAPGRLVSTASLEQTDELEVKQPKPDPIMLPHTLANTEVFLSLYNATNNRVIDGDVQIVDADRNILIKKIKANQYVKLPDPKNNTGRLYLVADVFGYRKVQQEVNYRAQIGHESEKYKEVFGSFLVFNFDLVRYHKGDIATLYNVYFYNDAAVMLPDSKYELNSLLGMLEEKPYKIVLHGHTNGNSHGKIITMGESQDFFSINTDAKEGFGSARDLSKERAHTIKNWLVSNGIAENRIEVKAWGGGRMIHDKHSVNAKKNVRVEVEVTEEL
jgi:outer membrane protein OmpA-like peptidoglycan-associated protein